MIDIAIKCEHSTTADPSSLKPHPGNPNKHPKNQIRMLAKSIEAYGWRHPIVVSSRTGYIIAGHARREAALLLGCVAPIDEQVFDSDEAELAVLLADNIIPELATLDQDLLDAGKELLLAAEIDFETIGLEDLMDDDDEPDESIDAEPQIDRAEELNEIWNVKPGDIWQLGNHRLMCGDSAIESEVLALMNGSIADVIFTDPPYGVSYVGKTADQLTIKNDNLSESELSEKCKEWFDCCETVTREGAYWIATVPPGPAIMYFIIDWHMRGIFRQQLVWVKNSMVLGHSEYHYKHEPILFGWKPGGNRLKNKDRTKTSVWEFDRPNASREHPTMKPVGLIVYGIQNHSQKGNIVYEPFCGSGTTVIASEQLGRTCYGMEIEPNYCAVILQRFLDATNTQPKRIKAI